MITTLLVCVAILCLIVEAINLFMLWYVPRRTRKAMNDILKSIDQAAIDAFVKQMSTQIIPEAMKHIDWGTISGKIAESMRMATLGTLSGDNRSKKIIEKAMTEDMLEKSPIGKILDMAPALKRAALKHPGVAKLLMSQMAPRIQIQAEADKMSQSKSINVPNTMNLPPGVDPEKMKALAVEVQERMKKGEFNV